MKTLQTFINADPVQMFFLGLTCGVGLAVVVVF